MDLDHQMIWGPYCKTETETTGRMNANSEHHVLECSFRKYNLGVYTEWMGIHWPTDGEHAV